MPLGVNFNVCVLSKWRGRYRSKNTLWSMFIHGQELHSWTPCVRRFHTPVINEVCSGSQEGKFWGKTVVQKVSHCSLLLQTVTIRRRGT